MIERNRPKISDAVPVSSPARKPIENTAPNTAMITIQPTKMIRPSISVEPTRDHQLARTYCPAERHGRRGRPGAADRPGRRWAGVALDPR